MNNKISDSRIYKLLISNFFIKSGRMVFSIFLNLYIWKETQDIKIIALFNIVYLSSHTVFFSIFARIIKNGYRKFFHIFSLVGFCLVYVLIAYFKLYIIDYILLIGFFIGFFNGIYWIVFHINQFDVTNFHNRGNAEGIKKSLEVLNRIVTPVIIGGIIGLNYFGVGLETVFLIGAILFLISALIGSIDIEYTEKGKFQLIKTFKNILKEKDAFRSIYTYSFTGFSFSNSLLEVILPVIIFSHINSESSLGFLISFFAIISMIGSYLFGRFVPYTKYKLSIIIAGSLYSLLLLGFVFFSELKYIILFTAFLNMITIFFAIPQKVISSNIIHKFKNYNSIKTEYIVVREIFLAIGWITGFIIIYSIGSIEQGFLEYIFYIMVFLAIIATYLLSNIKIDKIENKS